MKRKKPSILRGIATGVVAGMAATLIMDQFQKLLAANEKTVEKLEKTAQGETPWQIAQEQAEQESRAAQHEASTEIIARKLAQVAGRPLQQHQKKAGGHAVHYTFGTLMGVAYGIGAELLPEVTTGGGMAFGTLLFLAADEIAVPAFRLSPPPSETSVSNHLQHWAAHIVYGGTLELVRNLVFRAL